MSGRSLSRREFLRISSLVAAGTVAAACSPSTPVPAAPGETGGEPGTQPTSAAPTTSSMEAPDLADLVAQGELPPLDERLPLDPRILTPVDEIGTYGGEVRTLQVGEIYSAWNNQCGAWNLQVKV